MIFKSFSQESDCSWWNENKTARRAADKLCLDKSGTRLEAASVRFMIKSFQLQTH